MSTDFLLHLNFLPKEFLKRFTQINRRIIHTAQIEIYILVGFCICIDRSNVKLVTALCRPVSKFKSYILNEKKNATELITIYKTVSFLTQYHLLQNKIIAEIVCVHYFQ